MKKRLLSAALALAMVLTLLPVSAFAAYSGDTPDAGVTNSSGGVSVTYYAGDRSDLVGVDEGPGYYWKEKEQNADKKDVWHLVADGYITGSTWYANALKDDGKLISSTIIVVGSPSAIAVPSDFSGTLTVDVRGGSVTISGIAAAEKMTGLTVKDTTYKTERNMFGAGGSSGRNPGQVTLSGISISSDERAFTLELDTVDATGSTITATGAKSHTVRLNNGAKFGAIELSGASADPKKSEAAQTVEINVRPDNSADYDSQCVVGNITVTGKSSRLRLVNAKGDGAAPEVTLTGVGSTLEVDGTSALGDIIITGKDGGADENGSAPNVTIKAGTVGTIQSGAADEKCKTRSKIVLEAASARAAGINLDKADITVRSGHAGDVELGQGTVKIEGSGATASKMTLKGEGATTFTVTGTGHTVSKLSTTDGTKVTLTIPADDTNTFALTAADSLDTYNQKTIKGGRWLIHPVKPHALHADVYYQLYGNNIYTYYSGTQNANRLGEALTAQGKGGTKADGTYNYELSYVTHGTAPGTTYYVEFMNGTTKWGKLTGVHGASKMWLPTQVNGIGVGVWTQVKAADDTANLQLTAGAEYPAPSSNAILNAGGGGATGSATKLIKGQVIAEGADQAVRVDIGSNTISINGSLPLGRHQLTLELTTDVVEKVEVKQADGTSFTPKQYTEKNATIQVPVVYDTTDKKIIFSNPNATGYGHGTYVGDNFTKLYMANGKTYYTLGASVKEIPSEIELWTTAVPVEVTVNVSRWNNEMKKQLKEVMEANSSFDWAASPAVYQAINQVRGGTSKSQITTWRNTANTTVWKWTHVNNPTNDQRDQQGFDDITLVPYLVVNVTDHNDSGKLTATFTPSYRIVATNGAYNGTQTEADHTAVVVAGAGSNGGRSTSHTSLGALPGDMGTGVTISFGGLSRDEVNHEFSATGDPVYAHQDGIYDYAVTKDRAGKYTVVIDHAGKSAGLGNIIMDAAKPMIILKATAATLDTAAGNRFYNDLQAAIDDVKNGQHIDVNQNYKGNTTVNVTGEAREFTIQANGNTLVVANATGGLVSYNATGSLYTVKLNRDTTPVASGGRVTINSATGGSASVNNSNAKAGDTVTITLTPSSGYTSNGVTVTSGGQNISVSGSGNSYSFTMPSGSVTITPKFKSGTPATGTTASVTVSSPSGGSATTSAGSDKVSAGDTVTVTVQPNSGQRTMGLYVNGSDSSAVRTGDNSFRFTVPSGTTNVVVTPRFDVDNGTKFTDVWSTDYYSRPVAWAVSKGITNGTSTYTFGSTNGCTREDMVTFLYRAAGSPPVGNVANPFWDVQPGSYYYNAVLWAVSKGITNGVSANQFGVGQWVTRGQAVTFLYRYENSPAASGNGGFYDVNSRDYYAKAVSWASSKGVTNGTTATTFSPNDYCQRCQIVTFMYRDMTGNAA